MESSPEIPNNVARHFAIKLQYKNTENKLKQAKPDAELANPAAVGKLLNETICSLSTYIEKSNQTYTIFPIIFFN